MRIDRRDKCTQTFHSLLREARNVVYAVVLLLHPHWCHKSHLFAIPSPFPHILSISSRSVPRILPVAIRYRDIQGNNYSPGLSTMLISTIPWLYGICSVN
ncbi:hypothetical protein BDW66DRAFT_92110 [Aspergillus desertorum]